jgi:hypothetical protein
VNRVRSGEDADERRGPRDEGGSVTETTPQDERVTTTSTASMSAHAAAARSTQRDRTRRGAHGLTVLEVVLAISVLALCAGMLSAALGSLQSMRARTEHRLAAAEAAHRIVLQYDDDPRSVVGATRPIEVDGFVFDFRLRQSFLEIDEFAGGGRVEPSAVSFAEVSPFVLIQNRLWRVEVDIISREARHGYEPGDTVYTLARVFDYLRNRDAVIDRILPLFGEQLDNQ